MAKTKYPKAFLEQIASISNKRAKIVIEHIIKYGFITTEDLERTYGYSHPPRAARDVREAGITLETFKIKSKEGKSIAAYRFGDLGQIQKNRIEGRISFSKAFKKQLYEQLKGHCSICNAIFEDCFDNIDQKLMLKAVKFYCPDKWVLMYVERWLKAGILQSEGTIIPARQGTSQGGVISRFRGNDKVKFLYVTRL